VQSWSLAGADKRLADIADQVEEVQRTDPEMLARMVQYLMLRKTVFSLLSDRFRFDSRSCAAVEVSL
jgi:hypothetical protein